MILAMLNKLNLKVLFLLFLLFAGGVGVYAFLHPLPPRVWQYPPLYPSAENVTKMDTPDKGRGCPFECVYTIVSFQTNDKEEDVLAFYDRELTRDGGRLNDFATNPQEPTGRSYYWLGRKEVFTITLFTSEMTPKKRRVELRLGYYVGD